MCDFFPGFLANGSLGSSDQQISSPSSTPKFPISVESITEKDDVSYDSSSRRSSHVSIMTLTGKPIEEGIESNPEVHKSAMNLIKEKLKKIMFHASCSNGGAPIAFAAATKTKLNKIIDMFRKKVQKMMNDGGHCTGDLVNLEEEHWIATDADYFVLEFRKKKAKKKLS